MVSVPAGATEHVLRHSFHHGIMALHAKCTSVVQHEATPRCNTSLSQACGQHQSLSEACIPVRQRCNTLEKQRDTCTTNSVIYMDCLTIFSFFYCGSTDTWLGQKSSRSEVAAVYVCTYACCTAGLILHCSALLVAL